VDPVGEGVSFTFSAVLYAPETAPADLYLCHRVHFSAPVAMAQQGVALLVPIHAAWPINRSGRSSAPPSV
jgi:hypothetical protein